MNRRKDVKLQGCKVLQSSLFISRHPRENGDPFFDSSSKSLDSRMRENDDQWILYEPIDLFA